MRYLEKAFPKPALFGDDPAAAALADMWEHSAYEDGLMAAAESFRNSSKSPFPYAVPGVTNSGKIAALEERGKLRVTHFFGLLDAQLASKRFIAGDRFSAADITAMCAYDFAKGIGVLGEVGSNVTRWYGEVSSRPSAKL